MIDDDARGRFATAITCIDGRIQPIVGERLRSRLGVDHVDTITLPGVDAAITVPGSAQDIVTRSVEVSVEAHGAGHLELVGHTSCAGNPVPPDQHARDIADGVAWLRRRFPTLVVGGCLVDLRSGETCVVCRPARLGDSS